jgi:phytoene synthase
MTLVAEGYRTAERITRDRAKSFAFASIALDPATKRACFAAYAFCRRCDDAVDDGSIAPEDLPAKIAELRSDVDAVYAGDHRNDPILAAFGDTVRSRSVPRRAVDELIDGMELDLTKVRYETWDELEHYCELAAGTVGRMLAAIFGVQDRGALVHASALGRAMQLTNVMRDVGEDILERDRVYLPIEALRARGLEAATLHRFAEQRRLDESEAAHAFRDVMREATVRARALYAMADRGVPKITSTAGRACVRLMRASYSEILNVIEARRYDVFAGRASTSTATKVKVGAAAVFRAAEVSP